MRLERLNSFPVIAVAALILSALLGFALGAMRSGVSVAPVPPQVDAPTPQESSRSPAADREVRSGRTERPRQPIRNETARDAGTRDPEPADDNSRDAVTARRLPEGRVDPVVSGARPDQPAAAIEVTVSDTRGQRLSVARLALDVRSGPLGWHEVPVQSRPVAGERGVFRFHPLYPGEYRVRSIASNYEEAEVTARITRNHDVEYVTLTLGQLGVAEVEFQVRLEDGRIPGVVSATMVKGNQENTATRGRFGEHPLAIGSRSVVAPTQLQFRPDSQGIVKMTLNTGITTELTFTHREASSAWRASTKVDPPPGLSRHAVTLLPIELKEPSPLGADSLRLARLELTLTLEGKPGLFHTATLRHSPEDSTYCPASASREEAFTFENVMAGTWYVVAESDELHAPVVRAVEIGDVEQQTLDVKTGRLRVVANRGPGSPDPEGEMRYRVRLRPMGSGTIERAFNGSLTGKDRDHIDFIMPVGEYVVRVDSPENFPTLAASPVEQALTMTAGASEKREYTISAGASLRFVVVDADGVPVPNVEFLISHHPAGELPEDEKSLVRKGGYDGSCEFEGAPAGPVFVHVWTSGSDWNNPDHVFQFDLPAYGTKDLGAVVVE